MIANEIFKQLGGNKFVVMTGAKNIVSGPDYLQFSVPRCKHGINRMQIILNGNDTYKVNGYKYRGLDNKLMASSDDVYCENLKEVFEQMTGLYVSL